MVNEAWIISVASHSLMPFKMPFVWEQPGFAKVLCLSHNALLLLLPCLHPKCLASLSKLAGEKLSTSMLELPNLNTYVLICSIFTQKLEKETVASFIYTSCSQRDNQSLGYAREEQKRLLKPKQKRKKNNNPASSRHSWGLIKPFYVTYPFFSYSVPLTVPEIFALAL